MLSVDDGDTGALDQLERLYIRLGRWNDLKDIYAKKAELAQTPADKKQMLFVLGQVYDRELGDPERAVETYSSIIDLDPRTTTPPRRSTASISSWALVRPARRPRAPDRDGALAAEVVVSLPDRRAVARAPQGSGARGGGLPPGADDGSWARADGPGPGGAHAGREAEAAVLAAQVLEPIYESAGEWDRSSPSTR